MDRACMAPPWTANTETDDFAIPIDPVLLKIDGDRAQNGARTHMTTNGWAIDPRLLKLDADTAHDGALTHIDTEDIPAASSLPGSSYTTQAGLSTSTTPEASNRRENLPGWLRPPPIYPRPPPRPRPRPNGSTVTRGRATDRVFPPESITARRSEPRLCARSVARSNRGAGLSEEHREYGATVQQPLRGVLRNPYVVGARAHDAPPVKFSRESKKKDDGPQQPTWRCMSDAELRLHYAAAAVSNGDVVYVYDFVGYEGSPGDAPGEDETIMPGDRREAEQDAAAAASAVAPSATVGEADTVGDEDGAREFMRWVVEQEIHSDSQNGWTASGAHVGGDHGSMAPPLFRSTVPSTTEMAGSSTEDLSEELGRPVFRVSRHEPPTLKGKSIAFPSSTPISFKARQLLQQISHDAWDVADRQAKWRGVQGGLMRQVAFRHGQWVAKDSAFQRKRMRGKAMTEKETHVFRAGGTPAMASDGIIKEYDEALQRWGDLVTGTTASERRQPWLLPPWKRPEWCDTRWQRKRMPLDWTDGGKGYDWRERLYDRFHQEAWETLPDSSELWRFEIVSRDGETTLVQQSEEEWPRSEEALVQSLNAQREEWLNGGPEDFFFNPVDPYSLN